MTQYRFRKVSSPTDIRTNHSANYLEWGRGLTHDQYTARERHLGSQPPCLDGHISYWSYEELSENDNSWTMVSCCESLTRPALYKTKGSPVRQTICHSVGAVFTPIPHRGKGHARRMLALLVEKFDQTDAPDSPFCDLYANLARQPFAIEDDEAIRKDRVLNSFSVLWSDVGTYYEKFGYKASSNLEMVITKLTPSDSDLAGSVDGTVLLTEADEVEFAAKDTAQFIKQLDYMTEADGTPRAAILPSTDLHIMTHARAHFVAPLLRPDQVPDGVTHPEGPVPNDFRSVQHFGAALQTGSHMSILWAQDIGNNKLNILRSLVEPPEGAKLVSSKEALAADLVTLLQAAVAEARRWHLSKVTLWIQDLPRDPVTGADLLTLEDVVEAWNSQPNDSQYAKFPAAISEREDSWPAARPLGGRKSGGSPQQVLVFDGKYAWY
ncbi:uncharacterized protein SAPINGB_P005876 [Magnusiomyces paraingens]|uniref:LYC1 C-terminal domain-containing protein n=1 Tax=Magnusiomyces paraingens TaxID=2606893 RepID=A0A5E8C708_9ASCO|nr:uncharacterized protein SAPINGB_P005876 [Saprochaete ingens]VVT57801.1 unnamed protein product [Saprochaete ingens]